MNTDAVNTNWKFEIGATITHRDQPMPAVVLLRVRTTKGVEVYGVRRLDECEVRDLMIEGEALVTV
ncbi:hypothetical protein AB4Z43_02280 [Mesorhizobium sp. 2RAF45]|uniref:hypothetical protein n=1 Tax=Mesorhizobium sp. 2RAF45 TaxID=3233001 RepID=UPI003F9484CB